MNKLTKLSMIFFVFVFWIVTAISVCAAGETHDGVEVAVTTDKERYDIGEEISAQITVKNTNEHPIYNVLVECISPSGYQAEGKTSLELSSLDKYDETAVLQVVLSPTETETPDTGDNVKTWYWGVLLILSLVILIGAVFSGRKHSGKWFGLFFGVTLLIISSSMMRTQSMAAVDRTIVNASEKVNVGGEDVTIGVKVSYTVPAKTEEPTEIETTEAEVTNAVETEESAEAETTESAETEAEETTAAETEESTEERTTEVAETEAEETGSESGDADTAASAPILETNADGIKIYKAENGAVIIAAEELVLDEEQIAVVENAAAVGGKAVKTIKYNNASGYLPDVTTDAPSMAFGFIPDQDGSYYIWARIVAKDASDDSIWMSKDGAAYKDTALVLSPWSENEEDFQWKRIGTVTGEKDGTVIIRFIPRDKDALFDRFILTTNALYTPADGGQSPSAEKEVVQFPSDVYNVPEIIPTVGEHPRVMFRESDIGAIKNYMTAAENANALAAFNELLATEFDGKLAAGSGNYNGQKLAVIEAKAFDYAINGNVENGYAAILAIKNYINTCTYDGLSDNSRPMGHVLFTSAEVYDWCYDLLTEEDKEEIVAGCQAIGANMETGIPPSGGYAIQDHASEAMMQRDWLSFAIATYDEYPDIYNYAAGRFFDEFVPAKEYWFASGTQHKGSAYGPYRYMWDLWGQWLIYRMSGETIYSENASQVAYQWIYTRRPDGQLLREGDDYNEKNYGDGAYWTNTANMLFYASNFYKDPVLKKELLRENSELSDFTYSNDTLTPVQVLVFNDPTIGKESVSSLPLTKYFASPLGAMIARTGWNMGAESSDVLAYMKIGELYAAGHHHLDAGSFQIYYKGILVSESGQYYYFNRPHHVNYTKSSVAHNTLAITSSENTNGYQIVRNSNMIPDTLTDWLKEKDGELLYQTGEVIGQEYGPNINTPEYTYIAGDIAYAYDDNVEEAVRSMIFLPLDGEGSPAAFIVFDQITTKEIGSEKTFMLHTQSEPTIDAANRISIIKNTDGSYNGMLTNQTLLPADANIVAIGGEGKEFWVEAGYGATGKVITETGNVELTYANVSDSSAAEYGWGRIEISTTTTQENQTDYFLNVMYVNDADSTLTMEQAELIYGKAGAADNAMIGAKIFDRVVLFHAEKARTSEKITFTVPGDETRLNVNVAGLTAGTWTVKVGGSEVAEVVASEEGGIVYFTAPAGSYELVYKSTSSEKEFDDTKDASTVTEIDLMVNKSYIFTTATIVKSGEEIMVPVKVIFDALNTAAVWDETAQALTISYMGSSVNVKAGDSTATLNGETITLVLPAQIDSNELIVPLSFVEEILGEYGTVVWDELGSLVRISATKAEEAPELTWEIENAIQVSTATQSGDDGSNSIRNSLDGNLDTRWAVRDKGNGAWGIYDLGQVYTLDQIQLAYAQGDKRNYLFDIEVSEDGVNYTKVISNGSSCGLTTGLEAFDMGDVKARYVKYVGYGHTVTATGASGEWNSITEIVFIEKSEDSGEGSGSGSDEETEQKYTITFKNEDGMVISITEYAKLETVVVPENPTKTAAENYVYEFAGWTPSVSSVATSNATYTATYKLKYVVFEAEDVVLSADNVSVEKNMAASDGEVVRTKTGPATTPSTDTAGDLGFTIPAETGGTYYVWIRTAITAGGRDEIWNSKNGASYTNSPTLRWVSGYKNIVPDNAVTKTEANGSTSQYSADETDFGWRRLSITNVTAGSDFNMRFICKHADAILDMFIVTTDKDYLPDETVIKEAEGQPEGDSEPEEKTQYTVTFYDEDGTTVLATGTYDEGATLTVPENPTKAETETHTYEFAGWTPAVVTTVTADATYTATYAATEKTTDVAPTVQKYTVASGGYAVFEAEDIVLDSSKITIEEGTEVAAVSSGGKAIRTTTTLTTKPTATDFESAEFGFDLNVTESGNYYVWVRMAITSAACDSIWRSENGTIKETGLLFNNTFVAPTNLNSSKTTYSATETDFGWKRLTISGVTAGSDYSVRFISREPNVLFDKFIITKDSTFRPQLDKDYDPTATTE